MKDQISTGWVTSCNQENNNGTNNNHQHCWALLLRARHCAKCFINLSRLILLATKIILKAEKQGIEEASPSESSGGDKTKIQVCSSPDLIQIYNPFSDMFQTFLITITIRTIINIMTRHIRIGGNQDDH